MKRFLVLVTLLSTGFSQTPSVASEELIDPRGFGRPRERARAGADLTADASFPLLVIHWSPSPSGGFDAYQISGISGYHSLARVEACLKMFYSQFTPKAANMPSIIVCGNNWGTGEALMGKLSPLSQKLGFSIFNVGGWAFSRARLLEEPDARRRAIQRAFEASDEKKPNKAPEPTR